MVFCGKPSQGCLTCRKKKKRCDEARPTCGRCTRTNVVCPGYRDPLTLMFRDESEGVSRKFTRSSKAIGIVDHVQNISAVWSSRASSCSEEVSLAPELQYMGLHTLRLVDPLEHQAISIFFQNFVRTSSDLCKGDLEFLPSMYSNALPDDVLPAVVGSVGLACLSNLKSAPEIMVAAKTKYIEALRLTYEALRDSCRSISDQTCMAVILLGLYETITCCSPVSMRSWAEHIRGAVTLLELRGESQLDSYIGMQIFLQLRAQITISCLQREVAIPNTILQWSSKVQSYVTDHGSLAHSLADILARLCSIRDRNLTNYIDSLPSLLCINDDLQDWAAHLPETCTYTTVFVDTRPEVLSGFYHIYHSPEVAKMWNGYRCANILLHELIIHALSEPNSPSADNFQKIQDQLSVSQSIMDNHCFDICASVPYYLNFQNCHGMRSEGNSLPSAADCQPVIWPLYVAASMDSSSDMMRGWAMVQLIRLGRIIGTQHTAVLAGLLRSKCEISKWIES